MTAAQIWSEKNRVLVLTRHGCVELSINDAHTLVMQACEAIGSAQGYQDYLDGKIPDSRDCPNCKARQITPQHKCKRVKGNAKA